MAVCIRGPIFTIPGSIGRGLILHMHTNLNNCLRYWHFLTTLAAIGIKMPRFRPKPIEEQYIEYMRDTFNLSRQDVLRRILAQQELIYGRRLGPKRIPRTKSHLRNRNNG